LAEDVGFVFINWTKNMPTN